MGVETSISWTDHTFNPWWGCTAVSPGCDHCYAEAFDKRVGGAHWGKGLPRRTFEDKHWNEPLKWKSGKVFCGSMCDVMDDEAPEGARERLWELIDNTPNLTWQLLTKRPHRYDKYLPPSFRHRNVWFGTTCEDQQFYDVRWPILSNVRNQYMLPVFISYEPAIGPLTMTRHNSHLDIGVPDWLICGGESGLVRRAMETRWAENIKGECVRYGVKFFMKQMSALTPKKGAELIPAHLLVREFP